MDKVIVFNAEMVPFLDHYLSPNDVFVLKGREGFQVASWDGREAWPLGEAVESEGAALEAAEECLRQR